jgi:hypothetical protein
MRARFPLNQSLLPDGTLLGETIIFVIDWVPATVSLNDIKCLLMYAFSVYSLNIQINCIMKEENSVDDIKDLNVKVGDIGISMREVHISHIIIFINRKRKNTQLKLMMTLVKK